MEWDDPNLPPADATAAVDAEQRLELAAYAREMREYHGEKVESAESFWFDLTTTFRPENVTRLPKRELRLWRDLIKSKGVKVRERRGLSIAVAVVDVITASSLPVPETLPDAPHSTTKRGGDDVEEAGRNEEGGDGDGQTTRAGVPKERRASLGRSTPSGGGGGGGDGDDDDEGDGGNGSRGPRRSSNREENATRTRGANKSAGAVDLNTGALQALQKLYIGRKKFGGEFDEDLVGALRVYDALAGVAQCADKEMAAGIPVMLDGDALQFYAEELCDMRNYNDIVMCLHDKFSSEEQRSRLLQEWQTTRLTTLLSESPDLSQVAVFSEMVRKLQKTQRQLAPAYHKDLFLRDQLVVSADVPIITRSLRDKVPTTAQEAQQRIAAMLSNESGSAGNIIATIAVEDEQATVFYGLGRKFGGAARKNPWWTKKGPRTGEPKVAGQRRGPRKDGCWVCGALDHFAREKHPSDEVQAAWTKLKGAGAYVSVTSVESMFAAVSDDENTDDDQGGGATANVAAYTAELGRDAVERMANVAFVCGYRARMNLEMQAMSKALSGIEKFEGLIMDTGANVKSTMRLSQYRTYCNTFGVQMDIRPSRVRTIGGIAGGQSVVGSASIPVSFPEIGIVLDVDFAITEGGPNLLCLAEMKRNRIQLDVLGDMVWHNGRGQRLHLVNNLLVHKWEPRSPAEALYTEAEVRQLHRAFGHPSVEKLSNLLSVARPEEMNGSVRTAIDHLTKRCGTCSKTSARPRRFKLTVGSEDLRFNHVVAVDVMYLDGRAVLHAVDEATHFSAASFLVNATAEETWNALARCWSRTYLGPPDFLRIDQGTNFTAKEFVDSCSADGITVLEAPIECPTTMSHVERYHGPLRVAYARIRAEDPKTSQENALQLAVKCVNDTMGPEGLVPTLLVFGSLPRPARNVPADTQLRRARIVEKTCQELKKVVAQQKVSVGLKYKGPFGGEREDLKSMRPGAKVLVYRPPKKAWEEFKFVDLDGETVTVQGRDGRKLFRTNVVKPVGDGEHAPVSEEALVAMFGEGHEGELCFVSEEDDGVWAESRQAELNGLRDREMFRVVKASTMRAGERVYGTRYVDTIKQGNRKSRLVAQNYNDEGAAELPVRSPTVSRAAQRVCLSMAASLKGNKAYMRDVSMAYTQSETNLERRVFLRAPKEMGLGEDEVLLCLKPLYGVPESGLHWFVTYAGHHVDRLGMQQSRAERCLFYRREGDGGISVTSLQVDDSWGTATKVFLEDEEREAGRFITKPRTVMEPGGSLQYNGSTITQVGSSEYTMTQREKLLDLKEARTDDELVSVRSSMQYIATCTRPDIAASCQLQASKVGPGASVQTYRDVNKLVITCRRTAEDGLRFVNLDLDTLRVVVFCDASFANADHYKSQLGFCVLLVDGNDKANIVHFGSKRCVRVTRSVMAAELHGLLTGFDHGLLVAEMVSNILGRKVDIEAMVDSKTVFDTVTRLSNTLEKRLQIDAYALQEAHKKGELAALFWISSCDNVADPLTKHPWQEQSALRRLMKENKLRVKPTGWCHRIARED